MLILLLLLSSFSRVRLCATPWIVIHQAPLSMGFSRKEYWSGLPLPSPGDLPNPGTEPGSPLQADSLPPESEGKKIESVTAVRILMKANKRAFLFPLVYIALWVVLILFAVISIY